MAKRQVRALIEASKKRKNNFGGVLELLLSVEEKRVRGVEFNKETGRFVIRNKSVSLREIQRQLIILNTRLSRIISQYAENLVTGKWTLTKWHREMEKLIEESNVLFAALAVGSIASAARLPSVNRAIVKDFTYLAKFAADVDRGKYTSDKKISQAKLRWRARMYLRSMYLVYANAIHDLHIQLGYTEAMRILTAEESCEEFQGQQGCYEAAYKWMKIEVIPRIGTLVCGRFCKCYLVYRK